MTDSAQLPDKQRCSTCNGKGRTYRYWNKTWVTCVTCDGTGIRIAWKETLREFRARMNEQH